MRFVALLAAALAVYVLAAPAPETPAPPAPDLSTCAVPKDAYPPADPGLNKEPFFDYYAWQAFTGLICEAKPGERGESAVPVRRGGVPVFQTYKSGWEVFPSPARFPKAPSLPAWEVYAGKDFNPCGVDSEGGGLPTLGSVSDFDDLAQAGLSGPLAPIMAQNSKYVHYLTQFNRTAFDAIRDRGYYRASVAAKGADFPEGSITLKSAWVETEGLDPALRKNYYVTKALVRSPPDGACRTADVALLALHIVQKTPSRHARLWATFENAFNVPPRLDRKHSFTFFNPNDPQPAMPDPNPLTGKPLVEHPVPFNIERKLSSTGLTQNSNAAFQAALKTELGADSPWPNYSLVVLQWPDGAGANSLNPPCSTTTPGCGSQWAWANPVLETYFQNDPKTGTCIGCHQLANKPDSSVDFVWSLRIHSYPDGPDLRTGAQGAVKTVLTQQRKVK
jgi:hypothetical protein